MKNFVILAAGLYFIFVFTATFLDNSVVTAIENISEIQANVINSQ